MSDQVYIKYHQAKQIVEQQCKRSRQNKIAWLNIQKNKKWRSFFPSSFIPGHQPHQRIIRNTFKKALLQSQNRLKIKDSTGKLISKYIYDQTSKLFIRVKQYPQIINIQTLKQFIQKNPKGILATQQFLEFTYKDIRFDIQKLLSQKQILKIDSKQKGMYYLFTNIIDRKYGLTDDKHQIYGQKYFIQICKDNFKNYSQLNDQQMTSYNSNFSEISNQRVNEWVPGYTQLKKEWLLKNLQKEKQKQSK